MICESKNLTFQSDTISRCKNTGSSPITESPPSIDIHEVKRDLDKKHWCIPYHLTQSSMGARTLNFGDSVFLYTGTTSQSILDGTTSLTNDRLYQIIIFIRSTNVKATLMTAAFNVSSGMSTQATDLVTGQMMGVNITQHCQMEEWCAIATTLPALLFLW